MKADRLFTPNLKGLVVASLFVLAFATNAKSESSNDEPGPKVVEMEPYVVSEAPLGWLGLKHATIGFKFLKFVTFRKAVSWVRVDELYPNSPGAKAGIRGGDFINAVDGKKISEYSARELKEFGGDLEVGRRITVEVFRPETKETFTIEVRVVGRKPESKT